MLQLRELTYLISKNPSWSILSLTKRYIKNTIFDYQSINDVTLEKTEKQ